MSKLQINNVIIVNILTETVIDIKTVEISLRNNFKITERIL